MAPASTDSERWTLIDAGTGEPATASSPPGNCVMVEMRPEPMFTAAEHAAFNSLVDHWKQEYGERADGGTYFGQQHDLFESIRMKMEALDGTL